METPALKLFAIVELFGHQKMAGTVTEQNIGGASFVRVDVPETEKQPAFTRLLNPSAIYAINPVTEDVMRLKVSQLHQAPIESWDITRMHEKLMMQLKSPGSQEQEDSDF